MQLNSAIRALRGSRHWTQQRLADEVGVARLAVTQWESGKAIPAGRNLQRLYALGLGEFLNHGKGAA